MFGHPNRSVRQSELRATSQQRISGDKMRTSAKLIIVAFLALGIGVAYASPLLITPINVKPFPRVSEGPKAEFSVNVVYANFNPVDFQYTITEWDWEGKPSNKTYSATNLTYNVVLNVTNLSDQPATIYELAFAAAEDISVKQSILGGAIYDAGTYVEDSVFHSRHFGGIVDGVYLDGKWVNITWIPEGRYEIDGRWQPMPYPECLIALTQAYWHGGILSGPLNLEEVRAFSMDHTINGTIPNLPANVTETGVWFEGVPIAEYYDLTGNHLITEIYTNGSWVDVTNRVTVDKMQPFMIATDMLVNNVMSVGAQPYQNMNASIGPITELPKWGDWGVGRGYSWFPWEWGNQGLDNTWAPHESRLIIFNNTELFVRFPEGAPPSNCLAVLQSGNIKLYSSASNYINNWPVNGTYYNTVSTATQVIDLQLEKTTNGYVYNAVLADDQMFQPGNSSIEVIIAPRTKP